MKILFALLLLVPSFSHAEDILKTVSVRGEGEVKVKPDEAEVYLQVVTKAKDAKSAQTKNAEEMSRVQSVLRKDFKVDEKDIQTSNFNVSPDYNYLNGGKRVFLGYTVQHGLTVKLEKLDRLGNLLDALVGKGSEDSGVQLNNVNFQSSKRKAIEIQALEEAMKNAHGRAEALAGFAKRSLKGVLRISDSQLSVRPVTYAKKGMMMEMAAEAGSTQVSPGEISVSAQVAVEYQLD